jgi:ribonuclease/clavin/mitogillin
VCSSDLFPYAQPLVDGQHLRVGGVDLVAIYTPGHCPDHVCLYEPSSGTLFSGDLVLGASTSVVSDLNLTLASLRRLLSLHPRLLCPGHGPMQEDATRRIRTYLAHRYLRERQIVRQLLNGRKTVADLTAAIYPRLDHRLLRAAERNIVSHLDKLRQDGRVEAEGEPARFAPRGASQE